MERLAQEGKSPVYVVHFTQLDAAQSAQDFTSIQVCTREEKTALANALEGFQFSSPYGPDMRRWLKQGIGLHHAGILPKYRVLVEQLTQKGLLKIVCGTDTLGAGINMPIRTVLFTRLCKFDGQKTGILTARDFHQIAGRAGRKGFDNRGLVVAQAPEHAVENLKLEEKEAKGGRKSVKRKPPEKNFVNWDKQTFARLMHAPPERLVSRFQVSHGLLLNVLSRKGDGCRAMQKLLRDCHETPRAKKEHRKRAWQMFRSLVERRIIEFIPKTAEGASLRVNVALQDDFSMDQALSLYLHETLPLMDPQAPDYALVLLTLVESILENPEIILRKQLDRLKDQKMAEMKMEGIEYDKRIEELEKLEYPKPNREFIYSTFNAFADRHPWVGQENIRPKSIAREMFESFRSFSDYIRDYELQRAEGVLLRHLNARLQGAGANRARRGQKRRGARNGNLSWNDDPPGGFQPAGGMGKNARSELPAAPKRRKSARPARKKPSGHHAGHQGLHRRRFAIAFSASCAAWSSAISNRPSAASASPERPRRPALDRRAPARGAGRLPRRARAH